MKKQKIIKIKLALYILFLINICFKLSPIELFADDSETFQVRRIGEFKSTEKWDDDSGIAKKLFNLIMGDDYIELIRPVNILVNNQKYWILDQGSQSVNFIDFKNKESERLFDKKEESFPSLVGICNDENGNIYITDSQKDQITKISSDYEYKTVFAENVDLNKPTGIAYSAKSKILYVCETGNHRILALNSAGEILNIIGSRGEKKGEFNFPTFIWIDKNGFIYIIDSMNFRIQIFDETGKLISVFGEAGNGSGYLARPKGIATDSYGHIYIVDALFNNVQVFNKDGDFLYNFGNQGRGESEFWLPVGIYIDDLNKIYVSDSYNSRIQIFQLEKRNDVEN